MPPNSFAAILTDTNIIPPRSEWKRRPRLTSPARNSPKTAKCSFFLYESIYIQPNMLFHNDLLLCTFRRPFFNAAMQTGKRRIKLEFCALCRDVFDFKSEGMDQETCGSRARPRPS